MEKIALSFVIPVYNEEKNIAPLLKRLIPIAKKYDYEIIFVDDGSKDQTAINIKKEIEKNRKIKLLCFYRNFGHQMALSAGYETCRGNAVISMDADLQDPPEIIPKMVEEWLKGNKVVYAKRSKREVDGFLKKVTAQFFYRFINFLSDTRVPTDVGDYRLLDREVIDFLNALPDRSRFLRGLVAWGSYPSSFVFFEREKRFAGHTHYGWFKMINFALEGITSFSIKPLRISTYLGIASGILGFFGIVYELIMKMISPESFVIGWTGLFTAIMFIGGIQLITIGIIGEYVGKIYSEIQKRPKYLIKEKVNI